ncbi:DUF6498-containing protein [Ignavibacterium sp.]|uniref:DUF6498-containing protein n=1 Tax=Ignavibacterium sp. TaxID=2651167 RepID=UPI00307DCD25
MAKKKISLKELWSKVDLTKPSAWGLIASNLAVIFYAYIDNLKATEVLWMYWVQSVVIGLFNFVRILMLKNFSTLGFKQSGKELKPTKATKISTAIFFLIHYGFFHLVYGVFLATFPTIMNETKPDGSFYLLFSSIVFLINYGYDFYKEQNTVTSEIPNLGTVMFMPYLRIIPMHLTIILGGLIVAAGSFARLDTSLFVILVLMGLKTFVDLITHSIGISNLMKTSETL